MDNLTIAHLKEELNRNMTHAVLPVTILIGIETFVGMIGNILILLIYARQYKKSNFKYFVLSLAFVDLTSCCTTLPGEIFSQLNWYKYEYDWICKVKSYFNIFTAWGSASVLLILAYDRHRKISRPLAWQIHPTLSLKMCIVSLMLSTFVAIPIIFLWGQQTYIYQHHGYNLTVSVCEKSSEHAHDIYPLIYIGCVYVIPISLMIFVAGTLNFRTATRLYGRKSIDFLNARMYGRKSMDFQNANKELSFPTSASFNSFSNSNERSRGCDANQFAPKLYEKNGIRLKQNVSEISLENCVEMPRATGSRRTSRFRTNSLPTVEEMPIELNVSILPGSFFNYHDNVSSEEPSHKINKRNSIKLQEEHIRPDCNHKQSDLYSNEDTDKVTRRSLSNAHRKSVKDLSNVSLTSLSKGTLQQSGLNRLSVDCGSSMDSTKITNISTQRRVSFKETVNNCSTKSNQMKPDMNTITDNGLVRRLSYTSIPDQMKPDMNTITDNGSVRRLSYTSIPDQMKPDMNTITDNGLVRRLSYTSIPDQMKPDMNTITDNGSVRRLSYTSIPDQMKPDMNTITDNGSVRRLSYTSIPDNNVNDGWHLNCSAIEHLYTIFNLDSPSSCTTGHERHPVERISHAYRRRHKTTIMLILTSVFVISMALYVILTSFVAKPDSILLDLSNTQKAVFFFFWRLYFMNSVVNPFLYGFMDPRFRKGLYALHKCKRNDQTVPVSITTNATSVKYNHQSYSVFSAE